jgi:hypothetical protein
LNNKNKVKQNSGNPKKFLTFVSSLEKISQMTEICFFVKDNKPVMGTPLNEPSLILPKNSDEDLILGKIFFGMSKKSNKY